MPHLAKSIQELVRQMPVYDQVVLQVIGSSKTAKHSGLGFIGLQRLNPRLNPGQLRALNRPGFTGDSII